MNIKIDITQFRVDQSQLKIVKELRNCKFGSATLAENVLTGQLSIINHVPFSMNVLKLGRMVHLAFLPYQGVILQTDTTQFALVEAATNLTLTEFIKTLDPSDPAKDAKLHNIAFGIASGMKYANEEGYFHGDLTTDNIYISEDFTPLIHSVGLAKLYGLQRANDVKSYGIILETLFKGGNYTFENDLAQKIKDGIVNTFTEICDLLYQNYSSNYISKLTHFDNARNISDGTQFFSKCDFLFLAIRNIGTSPAVAISNAYLLLCGKDPVPVPPVNPSVIGIHSDNDLQKLICNFKDFKIVRELKLGFGISYVCEKKGKQYLLSTVPYNIQFKKRFDLLHPALSNVCGIILSDKDHPFFIVEDYGSEIPSNLIGESLLATAAALSYCHSVGIHHGQLRPDCITKVKDFVHLSLVGVSESFGHKVTDYDDVYSFGQLGLQLYKDCSPEVKSLFEECIKNKSMTMKTVFDRLSVSQISDDYCHMLSQFESRRQRAISGDRFAIEDIKTHMKLTSNGDVPLLPEIKESGIDVCPPLYIAAMNNNVRDIKRLIKSGANPNATAVDGSTALHAAVLRGNIESIRVLRNYCDRSSKDILGRSPHDVAGPNEKRALLKQIDGMTGLLLRSLVCLLSKPF
ncbi:hypothetical protein TVAG_132350 [Trichomonas vaginalis G3]|uniref:Serine-threonine/tyrosine-protein kinase catalytic domain-containing protein n=1 Tax=Trichomonas vaginalis (strain ATCC PRA-98 / G3) TaxID=412133 RepID=A2FNL7_TRIV3|nr:protein kinase-like (PK-like) family [Trichomonas vaginalis G3]EAX93517.1 hypothetical protein TVAG_132350 [Trichomonas vaginalis G3]KAI5511590.1 protein kinase-like (PK-like) family [Trichomonas vaginalis G3]|eukprot:XP_001306447.1 hypothetical protein [Trichomonas vaginalis G3]